MTRPRAADDFATIRTRMEELRRERECPQATESDLQRDPPSQRARSLRWPPPEIGAGLGRVRQSGSGGGYVGRRSALFDRRERKGRSGCYSVLEARKDRSIASINVDVCCSAARNARASRHPSAGTT